MRQHLTTTLGLTMWVDALVLFLVTVAIIAVAATRARVRFLGALREHHPELYAQLGRPPLWVSTSLARGVRVNRLLYANTTGLCREAEEARKYLRKVTVVSLIALTVMCAPMVWAILRTL